MAITPGASYHRNAAGLAPAALAVAAAKWRAWRAVAAATRRLSPEGD